MKSDAKRVLKYSIKKSLIYVSVIVVALFAIFPFIWMIISSIKGLQELYTVPPTWVAQSPTFANYSKVLFNSNIPRYFINSMAISMGSTAIAIALAILSSYGLARFKFKGANASKIFVLSGQLLPTAALIVPLYIVMDYLGLLNTYLGLILVYLIMILPLSVWMLIGYFRAIPYEIEEAGIIDGASRLKILFNIVLPLALPGIASVTIFSFVTTWNEFIFALSFATDATVKTLPIGLSEFSSEFDTDWGAVMAASVIMTVPIAFVFIFMQKYFIGGLTTGGVKG